MVVIATLQIPLELRPKRPPLSLYLSLFLWVSLSTTIFVLCFSRFISSASNQKSRLDGKMLEYYQQLASRPSTQDSLELLEADIHHANFLAASIPRSKCGVYFQMKLVSDQLAPILIFLFQWMDCSCSCLFSTYFDLVHVVLYKVDSDGKLNISCGRKATIGDFYSVILPSLQRLHCDFSDPGSIIDEHSSSELMTMSRNRFEATRKFSELDLEREDECGICLELCTKMVLPNCCHAMCLSCYRDWNLRSESCPFCRGSLKRTKSGDLWVLTSKNDVIDTRTVLEEDIIRFHLFINNLPKQTPESLYFMCYEYLI